MSQIGIEKDIRIIRLEEAGVYLTPDEIVAYKVEPDVLELKVGDIIPKGYKRADIEEAVGNLLIEKRVPILDYYSHLY